MLWVSLSKIRAMLSISVRKRSFVQFIANLYDPVSATGRSTSLRLQSEWPKSRQRMVLGNTSASRLCWASPGIVSADVPQMTFRISAAKATTTVLFIFDVNFDLRTCSLRAVIHGIGI